MKKIEIFGKKVPIFAILIALLVIGTASAAIFLNYATLTGAVDVSNGISVTDSDDVTFEANGEGVLNFDSPATFTINNDNDEPAIVNLVTSLTRNLNNEGEVVVDDYEGLTVDYSVIDGTGVEANGTGTPVLVPPGGLTVEVNFTYEDNVMPGKYNITVAVDYSAEDYTTFTGDNAMEIVAMSHKNATWVPIGEPSSLAYAPMGDEFYFELDAVGLDTETPYSLIYYADEVYDETDELPLDKNIGDDKWGGTNGPAGTAIGDSFEVAGETITGHYDLGMDVPCVPDENFDEGAKVWVVLTSDMGADNSLPMIVWDLSEYLFESSEILTPDYTDLVRYTDTDL